MDSLSRAVSGTPASGGGGSSTSSYGFSSIGTGGNSFFESTNMEGVTDSSSSQSVEKIFTLRRVELERLQLHAKSIQRFTCCNNVCILATTGGRVYRLRLDTTQRDPESVDLNDEVQHLFLDLTGRHLIMTTRGGDAFYWSPDCKPKKLPKLNGTVESVGFDRMAVTEVSTKSFLIGTSAGGVYEFIYESSGREKCCVQQFQLESGAAVQSIHFETISGGSSLGGVDVSGVSEDNRLLFAVFTTAMPSRIYYFCGGPTVAGLFNDGSTVTTTTTRRSMLGINPAMMSQSNFVEIPAALRTSELVNVNKGGTTAVRARHFAILTANGVLQFSIIGLGAELMVESHVVKYPGGSGNETSLSLSVSDYHFLILRKSRLEAISSLDEELVESSAFPSSFEPLGLVHDKKKNMILLYTSHGIFQVIVTRENRNVANSYFRLAILKDDDTYFEMAYEHSQGSVESQVRVLKARAEFNVSKGRWDQAASFFARAKVPFEEVALRLLLPFCRDAATTTSSSTSSASGTKSTGRFGEKQYCLTLSNPTELMALRIYLSEVLQVLGSAAKSPLMATQRTMLCTWLCEIFLHQISLAQFAEEEAKKVAQSTPGCTTTSIVAAANDAAIAAAGESTAILKSDFKTFLKECGSSLDSPTTFSLLRSRANDELLLYYAEVNDSKYNLVHMYCTAGKFAEAIQVITYHMTNLPVALYQIMPLLVEAEPQKTFDSLLSKRKLSFSRILPTILGYCAKFDRETAAAKNSSKPGKSESNHALEFMESLFLRYNIDLNDPLAEPSYVDDTSVSLNDLEPVAIHTCVWLLAKYDATERRLETLLRACPTIMTLYGLTLDAEYILRQCRAFNKRRSEVFALLLSGHALQAVRTALSIDIQFAKDVAQKCAPGLQKSLWLEIASFVVQKTADMKEAVRLIRDSGGEVTIEDLLPLLPDFTEIDLFRTAICESLERSVEEVDSVKNEIRSLAESVGSTVRELESMRHRAYSTVSTAQKCDHCYEVLMDRQFYLFPCSHGFHQQCLVKQLQISLKTSEFASIAQIQEELRKVEKEGSRAAQLTFEALQQKLDAQIAADCPLCGNAMICVVSKPFTSAGNAEEEKKWHL